MSKLSDPGLQKRLVTENWSSFAPFAYARYLQRGRGGLLLKVSGLRVEDIESDQIQIGGEAVYVTADDISQGEMTLPAGIEEEFAAYDPKSQAVFLFDDGAGIQTFRGAPEGQPSPRELYDSAIQLEFARGVALEHNEELSDAILKTDHGFRLRIARCCGLDFARMFFFTQKNGF